MGRRRGAGVELKDPTVYLDLGGTKTMQRIEQVGFLLAWVTSTDGGGEVKARACVPAVR